MTRQYDFVPKMAEKSLSQQCGLVCECSWRWKEHQIFIWVKMIDNLCKSAGLAWDNALYKISKRDAALTFSGEVCWAYFKRTGVFKRVNYRSPPKEWIDKKNEIRYCFFSWSITSEPMSTLNVIIRLSCSSLVTHRLSLIMFLCRWSSPC